MNSQSNPSLSSLSSLFYASDPLTCWNWWNLRQTLAFYYGLSHNTLLCHDRWMARAPIKIMYLSSFKINVMMTNTPKEILLALLSLICSITFGGIRFYLRLGKSFLNRIGVLKLYSLSQQMHITVDGRTNIRNDDILVNLATFYR